MGVARATWLWKRLAQRSAGEASSFRWKRLSCSAAPARACAGAIAAAIAAIADIAAAGAAGAPVRASAVSLSH